MDISKVKLLRQLGIIEKNDPRIDAINSKLEGKNEIQQDNWVHDIICGNKTLDEALKE
jgi:hypothetical protein